MRIKSETGFVGGGLLGVLGFSLVSLTIAMGNYKLNTRSINSTNIETVAYAEKALGKTLKNILENEEYCKKYLTGGKISVLDENENNGNFKNEDSIKIIGMKTLNPQTDAPRILSPQSQYKKKIFYVYYTKPALGNKQKRSGNCTNNDKRGCYHVSCEINYTCHGRDAQDCIDDINKVATCSIAPDKCSFPGDSDYKTKPCDENKIKIGITPCETIPANIFDDLPKPLEPPTPSIQSIEAFTGFKTSESRIEPDTTEVSKTCPEGQYPVRKKINGEIVVQCQIMCTGGSTITDTTPPRCVCPYNEDNPNDPNNKPVYKQGACHTCPVGATWNQSLKECICNIAGIDGQEWDRVHNTCNCPNRAPYLYTYAPDKKVCIACPTNYLSSTWQVNKCKCNNPTNKWVFDYNSVSKEVRTNKCDCPTGFYWFAGLCKACIGGTWDGGTCQCPETLWWNYGTGRCECPQNYNWYIKDNIGKCISCEISSSVWDTDRCRCRNSAFKWFPDTNECKCPEDKPLYHNTICKECPPGMNEGECSPCPSGQYQYEGQCINCPIRATWDHTQQVCNCPGETEWDYDRAGNRNRCKCPENKPLFHGGRCTTCGVNSQWNATTRVCECREGKIWARTTNTCIVCPENKPHWYSEQCNRCLEGQYDYDNRCHKCPSGQYFRPGENRCAHCSSYATTFEYTDDGNNRCTCQNTALPQLSVHTIGRGINSSRQAFCAACPDDAPWDESTNRCDCGRDDRGFLRGMISEVKDGRLTLITCICPRVIPTRNNPTMQRFQSKFSRTLKKCIWCPQDATWNKTTGRCDCPAGKNWWYTLDISSRQIGSQCIWCPQDATWNETTRRCDCPTGTSWLYSDDSSGQQTGSRCICSPVEFQDGQTFQRNYSYTLNKCVWCPEDATWNETTGLCDCPAGKRWWYNINSDGVQNGSNCID